MELQVTNNFSDITSEILALAKMSEQAGSIAPELYTQYDVKRGLRDLNGKGVLAGLTNISDVRATKIVNGEAVPAHGRCFTAATTWKISCAASAKTTVSASMR